MIGVELFDGRALAVAVGGDGHAERRASADRTPLGAAAVDALHQLQVPLDQLVGVATAFPDAAAAIEAVAAIGREFANVTTHPLVASGTAAALAEAWVGAGRGAQDVAYFGVGEHAVGGVVRGGVPVTGSRGRAPSLAWLALNPVEREDYRRVGCLEAEVAALGIVRRLVWRVKAGDHSRVQDVVGGDLAAITSDHVLDAAREGDGVAISVMRDTAKYLGMAGANLVLIADPDVLVLGGVMATATDLLLEPVRTEIARRLPRPMIDALTIAPALLGADAAAIGAARLASPAGR